MKLFMRQRGRGPLRTILATTIELVRRRRKASILMRVGLRRTFPRILVLDPEEGVEMRM